MKQKWVPVLPDHIDLLRTVYLPNVQAGLTFTQRAGRAVCRPIIVQGGIIMIGLIIVQALINVRGGIFVKKNKRAGPNKIVLWGKSVLKNKRALHVY